jgi:hypothetical protein
LLPGRKQALAAAPVEPAEHSYPAQLHRAPANPAMRFFVKQLKAGAGTLKDDLPPVVVDKGRLHCSVLLGLKCHSPVESIHILQSSWRCISAIKSSVVRFSIVILDILMVFIFSRNSGELSPSIINRT